MLSTIYIILYKYMLYDIYIYMISTYIYMYDIYNMYMYGLRDTWSFWIVMGTR